MTTLELFAQRGGTLTKTDAESRYEHGTYARYRLADCRCFSCRLGNADYVAKTEAAKRLPWRLVKGRGHYIEHRETGERIKFADRQSAFAERDRRNAHTRRTAPNELVSTRKARKHLTRLQEQGVGLKSAAKAAGMNPGIIARIHSGDIKRTRRSNEKKILAVTSAAARGGATIDGYATWKLLDRIVGSKLYKKGWIAKQLGSNTPSLQMKNRERVRADKARAVQSLYDRLWAEDARFRAYVDPAGEQMRREREAVETATQASRAKLARVLDSWEPDEFAVRLSRFADLGAP
jgi:hypothetical protein